MKTVDQAGVVMARPMDVPIARHIWQTRYRAGQDEPGIEATWRRVAQAAASVEGKRKQRWQREFESILHDFRFLPAGRIMAGAGTGRRVTLFNCFVMGTIKDTLPDIFRHIGEGALTLQQGGGIGCDFSTLRPHGWPAGGSGTVASGPVSFIRVWDAMCQAMQSAGNRRGAMMATLHCNHPDIEAFIAAKREVGALSQCNLSVLVSDALMKAVEREELWPLRFPVRGGKVVDKVPARRLWQGMVATALETSEPGMLFVDTINRENNLQYCETISATNPCGEVPLPPYGCCNLGSLNLPRFVLEPFTASARMDFDAIAAVARTAIRLLDNVIDLSQYPLAEQAAQSRATRRIGLGITGLADALIMLGLNYDSPAAREVAARIVEVMRNNAYEASVALAAEKEPFPRFQADRYLQTPFLRRLPQPIRNRIATHGMRNSHLLAIAPTGTISLLAGNVSSGIEPVFAPRYQRRIRTGAVTETIELENAACRSWRLHHATKSLPPALVCADQISAANQVAMIAALQPFIDSAISKTVLVNEGKPAFGSHDREDLFQTAWKMGLKGLTIHSPASSHGNILSESACAVRMHAECA